MEQGVAILGADVPGSGGLSGVESLASFQVRSSAVCSPDRFSKGDRLHLSGHDQPCHPF